LVLVLGGWGASQASAQGVGAAAIPVPTSDEQTDVLNPVRVGQTNSPYQLRLVNESSAAVGPVNVVTDSVFLTPSCGVTTPGANAPCPAADVDPGVFSFSSTGVGSAGGPSCVGTVFDIAPVAGDLAGRVKLTPRSQVTLATAGTAGDECTIDFSLNVLRAPAKDARPDIPGLQTVALAELQVAQVASPFLTGGGKGSALLTVNRAQPSITTSATPNTSLGNALIDTATVSNLVNPVAGSSVTFVLYSDIACGTPVYTSAAVPVTISGSTATASAVPFTPTSAGTYYWRAFFSGDANNAPISGLCNEANEVSTVGPPTDTVTTPPTTTTTTTPPAGTPPCVETPGGSTTPGSTAPGSTGANGQPVCSQVAPASAVPAGTARVAGVSGCATRNFNVTVTGRQIRRVTYYLDAKKVKTLNRPNSGTRFVLAVRPGGLRRGTHRVLAVTTFTAASKTKKRTLRVVFQRCARAASAVSPRFTG
jgi:hypothetical protein